MAVQKRKRTKKGTRKSIDYVFSDGRTKVTPLSKEQKKIQQKNIRLKNPLLITGFPGPGLVGSISANYIIQELNLHQIAYVDSEFITPGVIFIGGSLRHPFRLYADSDGNLCVLICEIPIPNRGIYPVFSTVVEWAKKFGVREIIVLDGIPIDGIPNSDRKSLVLSNDGKTLDTHFSPPLVKTPDNDVITYNQADIINPSEDKDAIQRTLDNMPIHYEQPRRDHTAIITGISGGMLAACLSSGISCKGLFIPATINIPDPEAAAILIETINELRDNPLNINISKLKEKGILIKKQLEEVIKSILEQQNSQSVVNKESMYT